MCRHCPPKPGAVLCVIDALVPERITPINLSTRPLPRNAARVFTSGMLDLLRENDRHRVVTLRIRHASTGVVLETCGAEAAP